MTLGKKKKNLALNFFYQALKVIKQATCNIYQIKFLLADASVDTSRSPN